jgi:hypothetical protein
LKCLARRITSGPAAIKQLDDQELDRLLAAEVAAQGRRGRKAAESVQTPDKRRIEAIAGTLFAPPSSSATTIADRPAVRLLPVRRAEGVGQPVMCSAGRMGAET